jgi:hypothetical protein
MRPLSYQKNKIVPAASVPTPSFTVLLDRSHWSFPYQRTDVQYC